MKKFIQPLSPEILLSRARNDLGQDPFEENNLLLGDLTKKEKSNYKWLTKKLEKLMSSKK